MSKMQKKSSKKKMPVDRPFSASILQKAREIAENYQIILHFEDGCYFGRGLELPDAMNDGTTPEECIKNTREMFVTIVAYMLENGKKPPSPAAEQQRDEQVNIRLTAEEKLRLECAARNQGFRGISDFMRSATLASIR